MIGYVDKVNGEIHRTKISLDSQSRIHSKCRRFHKNHFHGRLTQFSQREEQLSIQRGLQLNKFLVPYFNWEDLLKGWRIWQLWFTVRINTLLTSMKRPVANQGITWSKTSIHAKFLEPTVEGRQLLWTLLNKCAGTLQLVYMYLHHRSSIYSKTLWNFSLLYFPKERTLQDYWHFYQHLLVFKVSRWAVVETG